MRTPIQIFKKNGIHYYENDENEIEIAMQQYADEFACGFAEWIANNASDFCEANSVYGQSLKRGQWIYFKDGHKDRIVTTTELLEIYKQQINGL